MNLSVEMLVQVATALVSAGGVLWRLSERLKQLELDRQADAARLEGQIGDMRRTLESHIARSDERHASLRQRVEDHAVELERNRTAHSSLRQTLDKHGQRLAALGALKGEA